MTMSAAFFISSTGDLIHVPDSHIATVIRDPERFGLTPAEIETVYKKYGERVGVEGEARKELLLKIINQGWLRIRRYRNYWSVTAQGLTASTHELLQDWAADILLGAAGFKEPDRYMPVRVSTSEGETTCKIKDLANGSCP